MKNTASKFTKFVLLAFALLLVSNVYLSFSALNLAKVAFEEESTSDVVQIQSEVDGAEFANISTSASTSEPTGKNDGHVVNFVTPNKAQTNCTVSAFHVTSYKKALEGICQITAHHEEYNSLFETIPMETNNDSSDDYEQQETAPEVQPINFGEPNFTHTSKITNANFSVFTSSRLLV